MKQSIQISTLIIFTLLVVFPLAAMSEVKVTLKNGRDIIADSCRETNGKLVCEKMGGSFEIEQKDVLETKGITIQHEKMDESPEQASGPERQKEGIEKTIAGKDSHIPAALTSEEKIRLDQINQRKLELKSEREELLKEREQLQQEIKKADDYPSAEKFNALQKKSDDLDSRVKKFSSELKALNEEEKRLLGGPQQTP